MEAERKNFLKRIRDIEKLVDFAKEISPELDAPFRALYANIELLYMDYVESNSLESNSFEFKYLEQVKSKLYRNPKDYSKPFTVVTALRYAAVVFSVFLHLFTLFSWYPFTYIERYLGKVKYKNLPSSFVAQTCYACVTYPLGIKVHVEQNRYMRAIEKQGVFGLYNHISSCDSIVKNLALVAPKFVAKSEVFKLPLVNLIMYACGHYRIDRKNRDEAIEVMDKMIVEAKLRKKFICISPEGGTSATSRLKPFKKGPFYAAVRGDIPILPMVIIGSYELMPPGSSVLVPGVVTLRLLPPIVPRYNETPDQLSNRVRRAMLEGSIAPTKHDGKIRTSWLKEELKHLLFFSISFSFYYSLTCLFL